MANLKLDKYRKVFNLQLINLTTELRKIYIEDSFINNLIDKVILKTNEPDFFYLLDKYFTKEIEDSIKNKNIEIILKFDGGFIPISGEDIVKMKLSKYWKILSRSNKEIIWDYLESLLNIYTNINSFK